MRSGTQMKTMIFPASLAAAAALLATAASAQSISLSAGFLPDPVTFDTYSGGPNDARNIGGSCVGAVAVNADVTLYFDSAGGPLNIGIVSGSDTSLIIMAPDGRWYCDDDSYGLNPALEWGSAPSGRYEIWAGAVGEPASATIVITEGSLGNY